MRGYLSTADGDGPGRIALESRTEVYRREDSHEVVAHTGEREIPLGVSDVTVSRKKGDEAPVVITPRSEFVEVYNGGNTNGVTVRSEGEGKRHEVEEGCVETVRRDTVVEVGYQTRLQLVVERERMVHHEGEGDVVLGDQTNVDNSTTVDDSVINRSDIGAGDDGGGSADVEDAVVNRSDVGGDGGANVEDAVVNRSNVGGDPDGSTPNAGRPEDTQEYCERHELTYRGECPECATDEVETKFCLYCGEEIPERARHCPSCGEELPSR